jgi:ornithine cyclodeaminase/alanine dehydrogenase-like protein (mu-crystallin family)
MPNLICAVGANWADERELGRGIVEAMDLVVCDYKEQAKTEAADVASLVQLGRLAWGDVAQLGDVIADPTIGRTSDTQSILFKSVGLGLEDFAVAQALLNKVGISA